MRALGERAQGGDHVYQVAPQGRLAAGDADRPHPQVDGDPQGPDQLVPAQHVVPGQPGQAVLGHAVQAA